MSASNEVDWFRRFPNGGTVYARPADSSKGPETFERAAQSEATQQGGGDRG